MWCQLGPKPRKDAIYALIQTALCSAVSRIIEMHGSMNGGVEGSAGGSLPVKVQSGDGNHIKLTQRRLGRTLKNTTEIEGECSRNKPGRGVRSLPAAGIQTTGEGVVAAHPQRRSSLCCPGQRWRDGGPRLVGRELPAEVLMTLGSCLWGVLLRVRESQLGHWLPRRFPQSWGPGNRELPPGRGLEGELGLPSVLPLGSQPWGC